MLDPREKKATEYETRKLAGVDELACTRYHDASVQYGMRDARRIPGRGRERI